MGIERVIVSGASCFEARRLLGRPLYACYLSISRSVIDFEVSPFDRVRCVAALTWRETLSTQMQSCRNSSPVAAIRTGVSTEIS